MKKRAALRVVSRGDAIPLSVPRTGRLVGCDEEGRPLVEWPGSDGPRVSRLARALSLLDLQAPRWVGAEVLLAVDGSGGPVVLDLIVDRLQPPAPPARKAGDDEELVIDSKRIIFEGKEQIVLRCGQATITLTKAGKVIIRGAYVVSRSTGVNRIRGGAVEIN